MIENQPIELSEKELREQQSKKIVDFLEKIKAFDFVKRIQSFHGVERIYPFDDFMDFLVRINGILRDIPIHKRSTDGETVFISSAYYASLVPNHKDKEGILKQAYEAIYRINPGDEEYLLPAVINAVHLFSDGNGRTSRVLHNLLHSKSEEEFTENLLVAIGEDGRFNSADISPAIVRASIEKILLMRHGINFESDGQYSPIYPTDQYFIAGTEKPSQSKAVEFMRVRNIDGAYCTIVANEYLRDKDLLSKVLIKTPSGILLISPKKMEQELTDNDWEEILKKYYQLKKEHVEILIDSFVHPDLYKNIDGSMNLKDYFIQEIHKTLEKNKG